MQVTVLGSGSAQPTARRASAGYLVEWRSGALLLDASAGTYMRALKAGLDPHRCRAVALSHLHPDHTADMPGILWARRQTPDLCGELVIAGPPGADGLVARLRDAYGDWLETPCTFRGYPCEIAGLLIEAFPAAHSPEAVCLRLTAGGKRLAYSGDTADCEGLRQACADADLALLECTAMEARDGHLHPAACEAVVAAAHPARVLLTHLGPEVTAALPLAEDGQVVSV